MSASVLVGHLRGGVRASRLGRLVGRLDVAAMVGLGLVIPWVLVAAFGPLLAPNPHLQQLDLSLTPPMWDPRGTAAHPLGTDLLGRDVLARLANGARTSLALSIGSVLIAATLGSLAGTVALWGGFIDDLIMRLADVQLSIPGLLLAVAVLAVLPPSLVNLTAMLVLAGWVIYARIVRSEVLQLRELDFVIAARAVGASQLRIAIRHLLPNTLGLTIVIASVELAHIVILESSLSFLGLGLQFPSVSWGMMLADARNYLSLAPWLSVVPGIAISSLVLGINLTGDWLRDELDPRRRRDVLR